MKKQILQGLKKAMLAIFTMLGVLCYSAYKKSLHPNNKSYLFGMGDFFCNSRIFANNCLTILCLFHVHDLDVDSKHKIRHLSKIM